MWPDGLKPSAECIWMEAAFVSSVDENRRGLGEKVLQVLEHGARHSAPAGVRVARRPVTRRCTGTSPSGRRASPRSAARPGPPARGGASRCERTNVSARTGPITSAASSPAPRGRHAPGDGSSRSPAGELIGMGGLDRAPQAPQRSSRPGKAGARLEAPRARRAPGSPGHSSILRHGPNTSRGGSACRAPSACPPRSHRPGRWR